MTNPALIPSDMSTQDKLDAYHKNRDFRRTPEPIGGKRMASDQPIFVIQKHDASNLHYDFRLEVKGMLKSWAVPKGPSTDPEEKRLAVQTEDHPLEYADFEGTIPEGEYGGGTVIVWDRGTYQNLRADKADDQASMDQSLKQGKIEIWLQGEKLQGGYALIRTGKADNERWLLIKMKDEKADARRKPTSTQQKSIISGRTIEEIERNERGK